MARHFPNLEQLWAQENMLGREGVAAVASSLTKLERLWIDDNEEVGQDVTSLGRLPTLKKLFAGTCEPMQSIPEWRTGVQSRSQAG